MTRVRNVVTLATLQVSLMREDSTLQAVNRTQVVVQPARNSSLQFPVTSFRMRQPVASHSYVCEMNTITEAAE